MKAYYYRMVIKHPYDEVFETLHIRVLSEGTQEHRDWVANTAVPCAWGEHQAWHRFARRIAPTKVKIYQERPWPGKLNMRGLSEVTESGAHIRDCYCHPHKVGADSPGLYAFVHPTKTGGTAVEQYLQTHFARYISGNGHETSAKDALEFGKVPVMFIREPVSRFKSVYHYWKNGATEGPYQRDGKWDPTVDDIQGFIDILKSYSPGNQSILETWFTAGVHYAPQSDWLPSDCWSETIVVFYSKMHLTANLRNLLRHLGLVGVGGELPDLPVVNSSKRDTIPPVLRQEDLDFIRERYADDMKLWQAATEYPEKFKAVVGTPD